MNRQKIKKKLIALTLVTTLIGSVILIPNHIFGSLVDLSQISLNNAKIDELKTEKEKYEADKKLLLSKTSGQNITNLKNSYSLQIMQDNQLEDQINFSKNHLKYCDLSSDVKNQILKKLDLAFNYLKIENDYDEASDIYKNISAQIVYCAEPPEYVNSPYNATIDEILQYINNQENLTGKKISEPVDSGELENTIILVTWIIGLLITIVVIVRIFLKHESFNHK